MSTSSHQPSSVETDALAIARVRFLFDGMPMSMTATLLLSGVTTLILSRVVPAKTLYAWYACFVLLTTARVAQYVGYRRTLRTPANMAWPLWRRRFLIGCTLIGTMWGIASLLLFPQAIEYQVFLSFVIAGTSAGAVTTLSSDRVAALGFIVPSAVPLAAMLMWQGTRLGLAMGLMVLLYLVLVVAVTHRSHMQLMEMVRSNLEASANRIALERSETERRVGDEKLRALNDRLTLATEAVRLGIWEYDARTHEVFWDANMHRIVGHDPTEPANIFKLWGRAIHPEDIPIAQVQFEAAQQQGASLDCEYRIVRPNGEIRVLRIAGKSAMDPHLGRLRMNGIAWDVTELRYLDRLKSEFLATVSHELRTPLTAIRAALSLIANRATGELSTQTHQLMSIAERNAERLTQLIDNLLDIEKIESGKLSFVLIPQPLLPLLQQAVQAQTGPAQLQGIRLELAAHEDLAACVDANRFLQVMANLLSNAVKFSPRDAVVTIQLQARDAFTRVAVVDQGVGITAEIRARIFAKFSPGDASDSRSSGGAGLGLAIAKALVEQMGGTIDYVSAPGAGTYFFCEWPRVAVTADVSDALV